LTLTLYKRLRSLDAINKSIRHIAPDCKDFTFILLLQLIL
jgi:hypothetical protein